MTRLEAEIICCVREGCMSVQDIIRRIRDPSRIAGAATGPEITAATLKLISEGVLFRGAHRTIHFRESKK